MTLTMLFSFTFWILEDSQLNQVSINRRFLEHWIRHHVWRVTDQNSSNGQEINDREGLDGNPREIPRKVHGRLNASWKISSLAVNGQSFLVIDGYLLNPHTILEFIQLVTVVA
jgi:hypothetical protein